MTRVVYNRCYGGFSLSREACERYWELKGQPVWIENDSKYNSLGLFTVWLVPPDERVVQRHWKNMTTEERIEYNTAYAKQTWYYGSLSRHDPILVQVVEELGEKANGEYSKLAIEEVSGPYRIEEYDGYESVVQSYDDWIVP